MPPRPNISISVLPSVAAVQHNDAVLVAPDACVQINDTQPSGSPARVHLDDLAEAGFEQIEQVRPDVEHRAALEPPSVRERSAEERARDEAAAPARGLDLRSCGREIVVARG